MGGDDKMHIEEIINKNRVRVAPTKEEREEYLDAYIKVYCEMENINPEGLDPHQLAWIEDEIRAEYKSLIRPKGLHRNKLNWL